MPVEKPQWHKGPLYWINDFDKTRALISITFTWDLPEVKRSIMQRSVLSLWERIYVGGPAIKLMPHYFDDLGFVSIGDIYPGVLQKYNPYATRTTQGCSRHCQFCGVDKINGEFRELDDWPDLPVIIDDNLLMASQPHFDRVIDRLVKLKYADFNQGLDARLLTEYHAKRIAQIQRPMVRLALDNMAYADDWLNALALLHGAGIAQKNIRSYALIGFNDSPDEAWTRCNFIESRRIKVLPMWFHELDCLKHNTITEKQWQLGWNDYERRRIMQWFYKHRNAVVNAR